MAETREAQDTIEVEDEVQKMKEEQGLNASFTSTKKHKHFAGRGQDISLNR